MYYLRCDFPPPCLSWAILSTPKILTVTSRMKNFDVVLYCNENATTVVLLNEYRPFSHIFSLSRFAIFSPNHGHFLTLEARKWPGVGWEKALQGEEMAKLESGKRVKWENDLLPTQQLQICYVVTKSFHLHERLPHCILRCLNLLNILNEFL